MHSWHVCSLQLFEQTETHLLPQTWSSMLRALESLRGMQSGWSYWNNLCYRHLAFLYNKLCQKKHITKPYSNTDAKTGPLCFCFRDILPFWCMRKLHLFWYLCYLCYTLFGQCQQPNINSDKHWKCLFLDMMHQSVKRYFYFNLLICCCGWCAASIKSKSITWGKTRTCFSYVVN